MARKGASVNDRAAREERLVRLAPMVLSEMTQEEMASRLGVDQSTISRDIKVLMSRWQKSALNKTDERVGLQDAQYKAIIGAHLPLALQGKTRNAEVVMQALAQQAKLLGLDRPEKQQIDMDVTRYQIIGVSDEELAGVIMPKGDQ